MSVKLFIEERPSQSSYFNMRSTKNNHQFKQRQNRSAVLRSEGSVNFAGLGYVIHVIALLSPLGGNCDVYNFNKWRVHFSLKLTMSSKEYKKRCMVWNNEKQSIVIKICKGQNKTAIQM